MARYVARRIVALAIVVIGASLLLFACLFVLPGDPVRATAGETRGVDAATRALLAQRYGLDRPLTEQYRRFLGRLAHGDMGESYRLRRPVNDVLRPRVINTAELALAATTIEVLVGVGAAVLAAAGRSTFMDTWMRVATALAMSVPIFVVGLALQHAFAVRWHLFPLRGQGSPRALVLPALTLGALHAAVVARLVRTAMLEVRSSDYLRTARAKGLGEHAVVYRHGLRTSLLPVVTFLGLGFGGLLGGAVITETIFNWNGVGLAFIAAVRAHDNPIIVAVTMYGVATFVLVNLIVDLSYPLLDPRVRTQL